MFARLIIAAGQALVLHPGRCINAGDFTECRGQVEMPDGQADGSGGSLCAGRW